MTRDNLQRDSLPNVKAEMAGAWQALDEPTREAMLWLTAHFYLRDGHINEDGSMGSLRMRGHADLLDLVSYATRQERERCAKICEATAYEGCHVWRREWVENCAADIRRGEA